MRMTLENPRWGYTRILGALGNLGHEVGRGTIANVLKREGIEPAPERGGRTPWSVFLKAHWGQLERMIQHAREIEPLPRLHELPARRSRPARRWD